MKVFYVTPTGRQPPLLEFLNTLEPKLQRKLFSQFLLLSKPPLPCEPHVKHFSIEKYNHLYELRTKSKIMIRIIFTIQNDKSILLLTPFIKKHKRNTMQALDSSLKLLAQVNDGTCAAKELRINSNWEVVE